MTLPRESLLILCEIVLISLTASYFYQNETLSMGVLFAAYFFTLSALYVASKAAFSPGAGKKPLNDWVLFLIAPVLLVTMPSLGLFYGLARYIPLVSLFLFVQIYVGIKLVEAAASPTGSTTVRKTGVVISDRALCMFLFLVLLAATLSRFVFIDADFLNYASIRQYQTILIAKNFYLDKIDLISPLTDYAKESNRVFTLNGLEFQFLPLASQPLLHLFGMTNASLRLAPVVFSLLSLSLFYVLQRKRFEGRNMAVIATILFSLFPLNLFIGRAYLPEGLSVLSVLLFLYFYGRFRESCTLSSGALLFLSETLLFLSKPPLVTLVVPFVLYELFIVRKAGLRFLAIFVAAALVDGVYYLLQIAAYSYNNGSSVIGDYMHLSNLLGADYYLYLFYAVAILVSSAFVLIFFLKGLRLSFDEWRRSGPKDADPYVLLFLGVCLYALVFSAGTWGNTYYLVLWSVPLAAISARGMEGIRRNDVLLAVVVLFIAFVLPANVRLLSPAGTAPAILSISGAVSSLAANDSYFLYGDCYPDKNNMWPETVYLSGRKALYVGLENTSLASVECLLRENGLHVYEGPLSDGYDGNRSRMVLVATYPSVNCNTTYVLFLNRSTGG